MSFRTTASRSSCTWRRLQKKQRKQELPTHKIPESSCKQTNLEATWDVHKAIASGRLHLQPPPCKAQSLWESIQGAQRHADKPNALPPVPFCMQSHPAQATLAKDGIFTEHSPVTEAMREIPPTALQCWVTGRNTESQTCFCKRHPGPVWGPP